MPPLDIPVVVLSGACEGVETSPIKSAVCTATGPVGLLFIVVYSFLITFILPLPSEIVLPAANHLRLGLSLAGNLAVVIVIASIAKTGGSIFAFHVGQEAKDSGPVTRWLRNSRFDVLEWSEKKAVKLVREYGYAGLAMALTVPGFPDTISVWAFSILGDDYVKFAVASFIGSVGRFLVWIIVFRGAVASV